MQASSIQGHIITIRILVILIIILTSSMCCCAQSAVGKDGVITDVLVGHNNKGPYTLSWTDIRLDTVSATLDGKPLKLGADYKIDAAKGMLTFERNLLEDKLVSVSYLINPQKSKANSNVVNLPVTVGIVKNDNTTLNLRGLFSQPDVKNPGSTSTVVGMDASQSFGNTKITSQMFSSQQGEKAKISDEKSSWEKSVTKVGMETRLGGLILSGNFLHAGNEFAAAKEFNTEIAKHASDISAAYTSNLFQTGLKLKSETNSADKAEGAYTKSSERSFALTPGTGTRLSFQRKDVDSGNVLGTSKNLLTTGLKLDQQLGNITSFSASVDTSKTSEKDKVTDNRIQQMSVKTGLITGTTLESNLLDKGDNTGNKEHELNAKIASDPNKKMSFTVGVIDNKKIASVTDTGKTNTLKEDNVLHTTGQNIGVRFNDKAMQFQANTAETEQNGKRNLEHSASIANAVVGSGKMNVDFLQNGDPDGRETTYGTNFTQKFLQISMKNVESFKKSKYQFQHNYNLASAFFGNGKLQAALVSKGADLKTDSDLNASLDMSPTNTTTVNFVYKNASVDNKAKNSESDFVKISQKFGQKSNVAASVQNSDVVEKDKLIDKVKVKEVSAETEDLGIVSVSVAATDKSSLKEGIEEKRTTGVALAPVQGFVLKGNLDTHKVDKTQPTAIQNAAQNAAQTSTQTNTQNVASNSNINIQDAVKSNLSLEVKSNIANITANVAESTLTSTNGDKSVVSGESVKAVDVATTLSPLATVIGSFKEKDVQEKSSPEKTSDLMRGAMLELRPVNNTRLRTGYKYILSSDKDMTIRDYGAETNLFNALTLSGSLRDRSSDDDTVLDTKAFQLAFKPASTLTVSGEYVENPEDAKTGVVQSMHSRSLGLNFKIGSVGVVGSWASKEDQMNKSLAQEQKLGLEMQVFGKGKFTSDIKLCRTFKDSDLITRTYTLGYMHDLGSDFNLAISGFLTRFTKDSMFQKDKSDTGAQATLGARF